MDVNFMRVPGQSGFVPYIQNVRDNIRPITPNPVPLPAALTPAITAQIDDAAAALPEPETLTQAAVYVISDDVEDLVPLQHSQTIQ